MMATAYLQPTYTRERLVQTFREGGREMDMSHGILVRTRDTEGDSVPPSLYRP